MEWEDRKIIYRKLKVDECERINEMNPSQYIGKAWREVDGVRKLIEIDYNDLDWPNGYEHHYNNLKTTIENEGFAVGAFENDKLVGFGTINNYFFGNKFKYVLLDQLFISLEHRNKGIGKKLFTDCAKEAKRMGAHKIYICAGSAEETIAFYSAIGCKEAVEVNKELQESDIRDYQLEFSV
ncbi:MAG: GNAT family N-acetyltransferase [Clostridium sp.]